MNYSLIFEYAKHFLGASVGFIAGGLGVVVLGVTVTLLITQFFEDLRS